MTHPSVPLDVFRAWRGRRARLTGGADRASSSGDDQSIPQLVQDTGWMLAAGSTAPYLSLRARCGGCDRASVDQAVLRDRSVVRVRGVRGEPLFVPRAQAMIAVAAKGRDRKSVV